MTLITGHDAYPTLLTSDALAEELKHRSASSVSVNPITGSAKKGGTPKVEVMCQGEFLSALPHLSQTRRRREKES